jgi:transposase
MGEVFEMETTRNRKPQRPRRSFTDEFKAGAVALVLKQGKTVADVARDLDLTPSAVSQWVKQAKVDGGKGPLGALTTADKDELARLRKENRELRMERDILKKAAAFFAKEST